MLIRGAQPTNDCNLRIRLNFRLSGRYFWQASIPYRPYHIGAPPLSQSVPIPAQRAIQSSEGTLPIDTDVEMVVDYSKSDVI